MIVFLAGILCLAVFPAHRVDIGMCLILYGLGELVFECAFFPQWFIDRNRKIQQISSDILNDNVGCSEKEEDRKTIELLENKLTELSNQNNLLQEALYQTISDKKENAQQVIPKKENNGYCTPQKINFLRSKE